MQKIKLSASIIVKNEESCLLTCLESIKGVDEIVIVDTGSTDSTIEIAKNFTDKVYHGEEFLWRDDFAFSRNQSLEKCSGDWVLIIDADEVLEENGVAKIREVIKTTKQNCIFFKTISESNHSQVHDSIRLFKTGEGIHWKGRVHNYLSVAIGETSDIKLYYGYSEAHKKDPDRALRILNKVVEENPNCGREVYYLAREYWYRHDYEMAIKWYKNYLTKATWYPEIADAYLMLARCYWNTQNGGLAREACLNAVRQNPDFKEALLLLSEMHYEPWKSKWKKIADNADNKDVLFVRVQGTKNIQGQKGTSISHGKNNFNFIGPEEDHIFSIMKAHSGFYEKDLLEEIESLDLTGTYVDVGSNIGNHSLFFSTCCKAERVISIEPSPNTFKYLVNNVSSQARVPVEFINAAVSDSFGYCSMQNIDNKNLGRTKVIVGDTTIVRTLDSILEPFENVSLIKIDVEGFETKVLLGASKILNKQHPVLCIESATEDEFKEVKNILEPLGYYASEKKYGLTPTYIWRHKKVFYLPTIAVMATLRVRAETASRVVESISPQVDNVCVVLNRIGDENVEEWKSYFKSKNVLFYVRDNQMGDAERYIPVKTDEKAYYLSIDDDLIYPPGYVEKMVKGCEKYNCPVSLHGKFFPKFPVQSYIRQPDALYLQCRNNLDVDTKIQTPGCCVVCWRSDQIDLSYGQFKVKNRSDIEVGRIAAEKGIPIICLAHKGMQYLPPAGKTIWEEETSSDNQELIAAINEVLSFYFSKEGEQK
jgi:FkbM family methyltransferase